MRKIWLLLKEIRRKVRKRRPTDINIKYGRNKDISNLERGVFSWVGTPDERFLFTPCPSFLTPRVISTWPPDLILNETFYVEFALNIYLTVRSFFLPSFFCGNNTKASCKWDISCSNGDESVYIFQRLDLLTR